MAQEFFGSRNYAFSQSTSRCGMLSFCTGAPSKLLRESEFVPACNRPIPYTSANSKVKACRKGSASSLLVQALASGKSVDFPMVTDICELACNDQPQIDEVVEVLVAAMRQGNDLTRQLKAATVAHELLYDGCARRAMFETPGMLQTLADLRSCSAPFEDGPAEEAVRLLTSEVMKRLLEEFEFGLEV
uniref:Uncharacterized protein n=1 Tax=Noctiluca scintillans TaxID=2966 RepID=A0A7S1F7Z5_NOCSC